MNGARSTVAVLGYHKIGISPGEWESWYYVPAPLLAEHVATLVEDGWEPISAAQLLGGLNDEATLPAKAFLLTFDDAYRLLRTEALPWLVQEELPAVVFVPTGHVGGLNEFDRDTQPEEPICDWDDLRALRAGGLSIQSHGVSHRAFSELAEDELRAEVRDSKAAIEGAIGGLVDLISYPFGDAGQDAAATASLLRSAGYEAAFGYGGGVVRLPTEERFMLPRLAVGPDTDIRAELE